MSGRVGAVPRSRQAAHDPEPSSGIGPAFQGDEHEQEVMMTSDWPLRSYLELGALTSAVPCARLHARQVVWEWGLAELAETVELVASELVTNAVQASMSPAGSRRDGADGVPTVRLSLASDGDHVLVEVWDRCRWKPERQEPGLEAESGRGLLLIEALSEEWGVYVQDGRDGKIVWSVVGVR